MDQTFIEACRLRGLTISSLIYSSGSTHVFKASDCSSTLVAIKLLKSLSQPCYAHAYHECELQLKFNHLENVVTVFDSFGYESNGEWSFVIVMEWADKDLQKDIEDRKVNNYPWSEQELMDMASELIDTLAVLQANELAHRDLKPQNVFIFGGKTLKIGDFGSARLLETDLEDIFAKYSVVGTPFYMSPELKHMLLSRANEGVYNPYKSDVYSLGMIILYCYFLAPPTGLISLNIIEPNLEAILDSVSFPSIATLLRKMLKTDPGERPDFLQLRNECLSAKDQEMRCSMIDYEESMMDRMLLKREQIPRGDDSTAIVVSEEEIQVKLVKPEVKKSMKYQKTREAQIDLSDHSEIEMRKIAIFQDWSAPRTNYIEEQSKFRQLWEVIGRCFKR